MLTVLEHIFSSMKIETPDGELVDLHSHTSPEQGLFLQKMFDVAKPARSLEIGLAYGISCMFILEKHKEYGSVAKSHIVIEPYPWKGIAEYNIEKEGLLYLADIRNSKSDQVLPTLYLQNERIQFAYVDTLKMFDHVMQDIFFIDKILDVNGIIVLDDCGGSWPGIQKVARHLRSLPHYEMFEGHHKSPAGLKRKIALWLTSSMMTLVPFKKRFIPGFNFKTNFELDLEYRCIAFRKIAEDTRTWDWDQSF